MKTHKIDRAFWACNAWHFVSYCGLNEAKNPRSIIVDDVSQVDCKKCLNYIKIDRNRTANLLEADK